MSIRVRVLADTHGMHHNCKYTKTKTNKRKEIMEAYSNTIVQISNPRQAAMIEESHLAHNMEDIFKHIAAAHNTEQDYTRTLCFLSVVEGKKEGGPWGETRLLTRLQLESTWILAPTPLALTTTRIHSRRQHRIIEQSLVKAKNMPERIPTI